MDFGDEAKPASEGLRERKRRETLQRITVAGIRLFIARGFEATTLDAIAAEAGISRRTFFYYFKSKDDILLSLQSGLGEAVAAYVRVGPADQRPIAAVRQAIARACEKFTGEEMKILDRLMRSSEAVQARKQASYVEQEQAIYAALCERWPEPERRNALRLVAMLSIGAVRISTSLWGEEDGRRPMTAILDEAFDAIEAEV